MYKDCSKPQSMVPAYSPMSTLNMALLSITLTLGGRLNLSQTLHFAPQDHEDYRNSRK